MCHYLEKKTKTNVPMIVVHKGLLTIAYIKADLSSMSYIFNAVSTYIIKYYVAKYVDVARSRPPQYDTTNLPIHFHPHPHYVQ